MLFLSRWVEIESLVELIATSIMTIPLAFGLQRHFRDWPAWMIVGHSTKIWWRKWLPMQQVIPQLQAVAMLPQLPCQKFKWSRVFSDMMPIQDRVAWIRGRVQSLATTVFSIYSGP